MTTSQITQSLTSLLSRAPPPKLIGIAESLLSLSRQRAPTLKPDEEIARLHACAEIACKRSRVVLRLPAVRSGAGAPCRPAVYGRLVRLLEGVLGEGLPGTPSKGSTPKRKKATGTDGDDEDIQFETPSRKKRRVDGETESQPVTPSKSAKNQAFLDVVNGSRSKVTKSRQNNHEESAPSYSMAAIRKLCKAFSTPQLAPHVYTGLCIIIELAGLEMEDGHKQAKLYREQVMSLMIALYLLVLTRAQKGKMTDKIYTKTCSRSIEILELDGEKDMDDTIGAWINKVNEHGWAKGQDWWDSVPEEIISGPKFTAQKNVPTADADDDEEYEQLADQTRIPPNSIALGSGEERKKELLKSLAEEDPKDVLLPGLGTMMNDSVDYLSEDRIAATAAWTDAISARLMKFDKNSFSKARRGRNAVTVAA